MVWLALILFQSASALTTNGRQIKLYSEVKDSPVTMPEDPPLTTLPRRSKRRNRPALLNGWVPDPNEFCYGLPGSTAPMGNFDPLGFASADLETVRRYREAEVMHGRVAMTAVVGYLVGESASPVVWNGAVSGPANDQLAQIPSPLFGLLTLAIGVAETFRARAGWEEPIQPDSLFRLRATYYPGDIGFDLLGLKPTDPAKFADMQTRELNNGRLAMLAVAGMCAQEQVTHATLFDTFTSLF